jgi:pyridoxine kinase
MRGAIGTLLVGPYEADLVEHPEIEGAPHGTGDCFAAILTARLLAGEPAAGALAKACASVFTLVARAGRTRADELPIASEADALTHPVAEVHRRRLNEAPRKPQRGR